MKQPLDYDETPQEDDFSYLQFCGCLGLIGVVVLLVAAAIDLGAAIFMGTLP